ncbi:DUF4199 domain-containing protein [Aquimarina pacifica]|uniref:DUF4199 domain-containing protein n=1 Tax=Aquimarina pacifica TaxID=1296415 RepID=UPI00046EAEBB|nr:DUF4199 domain-containing protein [Aquimarina pacifica]
MKNTILRYGIKSAITICILALIGWIFGKNLDYSIQEIIGYAGMIVSLAFVFFGIKYYRDQENSGKVSFGKALWIGTLISFMAALAFGILDSIYVTYINPDFMNDYYTYYVEQLRSSLTDEEFQIKLKELNAQKELFSNVFMSFFIMFATVMSIGLIISLLSALALQRK